MNISVNTSQLAKKLKLVDKIISKTTLLPILANVQLRTSLGEVSLTTTNMEIALTTACPVTVNEPGVVTVPAKSLLQALSQIGDTETHLTLEKNQLRIAAGTFKLRLPTLPYIDFPAIPETPDGGILLPGDIFKPMIRRVRYAISDTDRRFLLAGALLSITDDVIALVATDGKRLAMTAMKRTVPGKTGEIVIPTKTLDVLLSDDSGDEVLFTSSDKHLFFVSQDSVLASRRLDGQFPNYQRIIPKENVHCATIPRLQLQSALRRVALASGDTKAITFDLELDSLSLTSCSTQGDAVEHVPVRYNGPTFKLTFEWTYVNDFLNVAAGTDIELLLRDATTQTLWRDGADFMNVIMQMRS